MRGKMKKSAAEKPSTTFLSNQEEPKKHKPMTASASQISKITPNVPGVAHRLFVQRFPRGHLALGSSNVAEVGFIHAIRPNRLCNLERISNPNFGVRDYRLFYDAGSSLYSLSYKESPHAKSEQESCHSQERLRSPKTTAITSRPLLLPLETRQCPAACV